MSIQGTISIGISPIEKRDKPPIHNDDDNDNCTDNGDCVKNDDDCEINDPDKNDDERKKTFFFQEGFPYSMYIFLPVQTIAAHPEVGHMH